MSEPPGFGVPVAPEEEDEELDVELPPDDDDEAALELELEPPQAETNAAMTNRQAAIAASLLDRMASLILIPGSPRVVQLLAGAALAATTGC